MAIVTALGALAFLVGCGAEERINEARTSPPVRVSVSITDDAITVQPNAIGIGPARTQQIPQNQNSAQPPIRTNAPLTVVFVAANLTDSDSRLEVRGAKNATSGPLTANSNGSLQVDLPTGAYLVSAADIPGAKPARLAVGPYRASSQNDVLLP
ncbi:MAG TPA: hypothetical protein VF176_08740 [Solirubrobacterales bacterium]